MILLSVFFLCLFVGLQANQKMYIDSEEVCYKQNCFHIHTGHNVWIETDTVHRDASGLYIFEDNIQKCTEPKMEYERTWKCPYCFYYWPIGIPCGNEACPSRYLACRDC